METLISNQLSVRSTNNLNPRVSICTGPQPAMPNLRQVRRPGSASIRVHLDKASAPHHESFSLVLTYITCKVSVHGSVFQHDLTTRHWPAVEPGTVEIRDEDKQKAAEATPNPLLTGTLHVRCFRYLLMHEAA
jgi:hypothetical protein